VFELKSLAQIVRTLSAWCCLNPVAEQQVFVPEHDNSRDNAPFTRTLSRACVGMKTAQAVKDLLQGYSGQNYEAAIDSLSTGETFVWSKISGIRDEVEMVLTTPERRSLTRFPLQLLVKIQICGTDALVFAETKNISAGGIYMYTSSHLDLGSELELSLALPPQLTQSATAIDIACKGKVLRVDKDPSGTTGIAAEIFSYDFLANAAGVSGV
jgi:PilZ domain